MQIEESRESTLENEQVISWFRLTGREIRTALAAPLDGDEIRNPGKPYPTDAGSSSVQQPYGVLIDRLGERVTDWGLD